MKNMEKIKAVTKDVFIFLVGFSIAFFILKQFLPLPEAEFRLIFAILLTGYIILLLNFPKLPSTVIFLLLLCFLLSWNYESLAKSSAVLAYVFVIALFIQHVRGKG